MKKLKIMAVLAAAAGLAGCSGGAPSATVVNGVVKVNGEGAAMLTVEFHPDGASDQHNSPSSFGETDEQGRFTLKFTRDGESFDGAVPGQHRVVLTDKRLAESETGRGVKMRIPRDCGLVTSTPIVVTVNEEGPQEIIIPVPPIKGRR